MSFNIIGISALYHDSACCLIQNGKLVTAVQEERFTRIKNDSSIPVNAFKYCLDSANLTIADIDCIAYYEIPEIKLARQIWSGYDIEEDELTERMDPFRPEMEIRNKLGYTGRIEYVKHHLSHAASSFYFSGFNEAAIMTIDGVGEWDTTTYGIGNEDGITILDNVSFPDSLGLFYSTITSYLGFSVNSGEFKVMGLSPYGKPKYVDEMRKLIRKESKGQYSLDMKYFEFISGQRMYSQELIDLFGHPPRVKDSSIDQFHKDVAKSLQLVLEEILLDKVNYLYSVTDTDNLCLAGGVALNCVANGKILENGSFKHLFVQPAANDAGCCLGAAVIAHNRLSLNQIKPKELKHVYLGPEYEYDEMKKLLEATSLQYDDYYGDTESLLKETSKLISQGKVIGWFQGRMEFGPRALGSRSIIADPRSKVMRDLINSMVKKREGFRPFAPAVIKSKAKDHFDIEGNSPFMLRTCQVRSPISLPAITHVDGSARVQTVDEESNPRFFRLIEEFERQTDCPILLNTSFNVRGEPIVMSPYDAISCFINTKIDSLILGDFIIERSKNSMSLMKLVINNLKEIEKNVDISDRVYTFI